MTNPALQAGEYWRVENGTAQVSMPASGEGTYLPAKRTFVPSTGFGCWPKSGETVPVAARTRVQ